MLYLFDQKWGIKKITSHVLSIHAVNASYRCWILLLLFILLSFIHCDLLYGTMKLVYSKFYSLFAYWEIAVENIIIEKKTYVLPTEKASIISFMKTNTLFITTNVLSSFTWQSNSLNVESKWITASSTLNDLFDRIHKDNIYINLELYLHWGVFMIERRVPNKIVQTWL